jgi:hypothetical protein
MQFVSFPALFDTVTETCSAATIPPDNFQVPTVFCATGTFSKSVLNSSLEKDGKVSCETPYYRKSKCLAFLHSAKERNQI